MKNKFTKFDREIASNLPLYTSAIQPIPKRLVIANYSGILTCYDLMLRSHQSKNKTILVIQPFWLDSVHESRLDTLWGQNVREFPRSISQLLREIYPGIDKQERLTFRQVQFLRRECIRRLQNSAHFSIIEGPCHSLELIREKVKRQTCPLPIEVYYTSMKPIKKLSDMHIWNQIEYIQINVQDGKIHRYALQNRTKIYNFSQLPVRDSATDKLPLQTDIYHLPKGLEPPRIIILGAGLSAIWAMEQAAHSKVRVAIRNEQSQIAPQIARNKNYPIKKENCLLMDQCFLLPLQSLINSPLDIDKPDKKAVKQYAKKNDINLHDISANDRVFMHKKKKEVLDIGSTYTGYGFITDKKITHKLPDSMVASIDSTVQAKNFYAPKNIPFNAFFGRHEAQKRLLLSNKFRLEDINLQALVIREEDKIHLARALNTPIEFWQCLENHIKDLEDTPEDVAQFIKDVYISWANTRDEMANFAFFSLKLDDLLLRSASISSGVKNHVCCS